MHWEKRDVIVTVFFCEYCKCHAFLFLSDLCQAHTHVHSWKGSPVFCFVCFMFQLFLNAKHSFRSFILLSMYDSQKWKMFQHQEFHQIDTLENLFLFLPFLFFRFFLAMLVCPMNNWCVYVCSWEWNTHARILQCEENVLAADLNHNSNLKFVQNKIPYAELVVSIPIDWKSLVTISVEW